MAIACRLILSKGVSGDSVNPCESVLESFETGDICLLGFAISLQMHFVSWGRSFIYSGFA